MLCLRTLHHCPHYDAFWSSMLLDLPVGKHGSSYLPEATMYPEASLELLAEKWVPV